MAIDNQPKSAVLETPIVAALGYLLILVGNTFVLSSMWKLGVTGTYLGRWRRSLRFL